MAHAVRTRKDSPHNLSHRLMFLWRLRYCGGFIMRGGDIRKQVTRFLFADDLEVSQRNDERLTDAESAMPSASGVRSFLVILILQYQAERISSWQCMS